MSISSIFYTRLFRKKDNCATFSSYVLALAKGFWQKKHFRTKKCARKMLMKLTLGGLRQRRIFIFGYNQSAFTCKTLFDQPTHSFPTKSSCPNNITSSLTLVKFITEDTMLRNTYSYENRIFTNKVNQSIIWVGKRKDRVPYIKSLHNKDEKGNRQLVEKQKVMKSRCGKKTDKSQRL